MNDDVCIATHVTPTESGRWLVFVAGKGYPVALVDEVPSMPTMIVESDVTVLLDPAVVVTALDPVFFAPSRRTAVLERIAA